MILNYLRCAGRNYTQIYQSSREDDACPHTADSLQLAALAVFFLLAALILYSSKGYHAWFAEINSASANIPDFVLHMLTSFGDGALILALILIFAPKHVQFHWVSLIAALIGGLVSNLLKDYFDMVRPPAALAEGTFNLIGKAYHQHSFPSGHTLTAFLIASAAYFFLEHRKTKVTLLLLACGVGLSRVLVGIHWPLDVLVGAALGIFSGVLSVLLAYKWRRFLSKGLHLFILCLLLAACFQLLFQKKDYPLANLLLFTTAFIGIIQFAKSYLLLNNKECNTLVQQSAAWQKIFKFFSHPPYLFLFILTALTLYRVAVILQPHLAIFYDESYYYHWSLYPDLGYYSKPPMVAWCIWLSSHLLGPSTLGVKFSSPLLYAGSALIIYHLGSFITGRKTTGLYGGILFLCIPLIGFNSEFITTDAPLFFFWSASLYAFFVSLKSGKVFHWLLLGLVCGLGMLSKYTMGALPLSLFLYLLYSKQNRHQLSLPGPWLAAIVAGLIFSLNLYWNFQHDWIAAKHTQEISQTSGTLFRFAPLLGFIFTQAFIFGPVWSFLLIKHGRSLFSGNQQVDINQREAVTILLFSSATIFIAIALQAFLSRAFANWAGPWMVGATLLLAIAFKNIPKKWITIGAISQLILLSTFYHWPYIAEKISVPLSKKTDPYFRVLGWQALAAKLSPYLEQHPEAILASNSRDLLAYMGFYCLPNQLKFARWQAKPNNIRDWYDLKFNLRQYQNRPEQSFVFVSGKALPPQALSQFNQIEQISTLKVEVYTKLTRNLHVYFAKGFKGYGEENE